MKSPAQTPHIGVRAVRSEPHGSKVHEEQFRPHRNTTIGILVDLSVAGVRSASVIGWGAGAYLGYVDNEKNLTAVMAGDMIPLIGIGDVASLIGVPVATMYEWRTRGKGPAAYRFGKHLRFSVADVAEWIESCRVDGSGKNTGGEDSSLPCHPAKGRISATCAQVGGVR